MISDWLLTVLRCPVCVRLRPCADTGVLAHDGTRLICQECGAHYPMCAGYVDMRPTTGMTGKETIYTDASANLDNPSIRPPVLSAGVRQQVLRLMLRPRRSDTLLDIGCGNGNFAIWNRESVAHVVGLDAAARFAPAARASVDLVQGDARALPFARGTFSSAYSLDVFEHLDLAGVRDHLRETRRVIRESGAYFCFSNTRESSWLNRLIDPGRRLAEMLHRAGVVDRTRDHLRKGDHVKAVATADALAYELAASGFRVSRLWFLNPLAATYIETLGFAVVERILTRRHASGDASSARDTAMSSLAVRDRAARQPLVRFALRVATAALMMDITFFRTIRTGPFFLLARPTRRL